MRETVDAKARRYLGAGRLLIERVDEHGIAALCVGDTGEYEVGREDGEWRCSCPARGRCSHLVALWLVIGGSA